MSGLMVSIELDRPLMVFNKKQLRTIGLGVVLVNWFVQRLLRVNGRCRQSVHFSSRVSFPDRIEWLGDVLCREAEICLASSNGSYIQARNGLKIDRSARFASGVKLISANHEVEDRARFAASGPIELSRNVWLGANVVVLPGVHIGENTIIGAGSVVTRDIPANVVAAGVPCRVMRALN